MAEGADRLRIRKAMEERDYVLVNSILSEKKIAGAALDCFNDEPVLKPNRFSELDNIILAPHSIAWTQELFRDMGMMCSQNMIDLANGIRPHGVVNPEVFDRLSFQKKWENLRVQPNPTSS